MKLVRKSCAALVAALTLGIGTGIMGQNANPTDPKGTPGRLVKLNLIVTDSADHSLDKIRKEDVQVFEGNMQQTITLFEKDERPIDYGIAIDMSGSFRQVSGSVLDVLKEMIDNLRPNDEMFIERFISSDKIETIQDFTANKELLLAARKQMRVEGGQSAIIDGVYLAVAQAARHAQKERRSSVVLVTDGEDRSSHYSLEQLVKLLRETNIQVFVIGITTELDKENGLIRRSPRQKAESLLTTIAEESGGRLFLLSNESQLKKAAAEIIQNLHSQYSVSYFSTSAGSSDFQKVTVKLLSTTKGDKRKVIAPRGYWLKVPPLDSKSKDKKAP